MYSFIFFYLILEVTGYPRFLVKIYSFSWALITRSVLFLARCGLQGILEMLDRCALEKAENKVVSEFILWVRGNITSVKDCLC